MSRWPDFFVVGAAGAGTSSLHHYLKGHPDIFMPPVKETHFFARLEPGAQRLRYLGVKLITEEEEYLHLFAAATSEQAIGEACPSYLYDQHAPLRIREKIPGAKIAIVLRDPCDRAYSHYLMYVREGAERKPFYDALKEDYARPQKAWGVSRLYVELGLYHDQVKRYLDTFGPGQVRIYLFEDLAADPVAVVQDFCAFLGVPFYGGRFFDPTEKYNAYAAPRNTLFGRIMGSPGLRSLAISLLPKQLLVALRKSVLLAEGPKPPMDPRAGQFLRPLFHDDIRKLQGLIDRDLRHWLAESQSQGPPQERPAGIAAS